jgi:hypothetical protein
MGFDCLYYRMVWRKSLFGNLDSVSDLLLMRGQMRSILSILLLISIGHIFAQDSTFVSQYGLEEYPDNWFNSYNFQT